MGLRITQSFGDDLTIALGHYAVRAGARHVRWLIELFQTLCLVVRERPFSGLRLEGHHLWWRPLGPLAAIYHVDEPERMVTLLRLYNRASRGCEGILGDDVGELGDDAEDWPWV